MTFFRKLWQFDFVKENNDVSEVIIRLIENQFIKDVKSVTILVLKGIYEGSRMKCRTV